MSTVAAIARDRRIFFALNMFGKYWFCFSTLCGFLSLKTCLQRKQIRLSRATVDKHLCYAYNTLTIRAKDSRNFGSHYLLGQLDVLLTQNFEIQAP
jgi:hypothetical protein